MATNQKNDGSEGATTKSKRRSFLLAPQIKAAASQKVLPGDNQKKRQKSPDVVESTNEARLLLGDIVSISGVKSGILRYFGPTKFATGDWCGVELSCQDGKHDGAVKGIRYFACPPNRGIFAPSHKVAHVSRTDSAETHTLKDALPPTGSKVSCLAKGRKSTSRLVQPLPLPKSKKTSLDGIREGSQPGGKGVGNRPGKAGKAVKLTAKTTNANTSFDLHTNSVNQSQPPIDLHKALTFAYDIEPNSPESDLTTQQLADTFKVGPNVTTRRIGLPRSHSSISDLHSPVYPRGVKLPRSLSQFAVVSSLPDGAPWRDVFDDPLTPSQVSNASSLELLTDTQLGSVSFSLDLAGDDRRPSATLLDYELDWDMSDISSPRQPHKDSRSSTPVTTETVPLQSEVSGGHTSTPTSPLKVTGNDIDTGGHDLVITDDGGHDVIMADDVGHDLVTTDEGDHDLVMTDDSDHDVVRTCTGGHDLVTTIDDTHDLVTTIASAHDLDEGDHDLMTTGDRGHDFVTASEGCSDLVTVGKGSHDFVSTVDDGHDLVTTIDGECHDMVTTIDDGHDLVTMIDDGHGMITTIDGGHDMVTTIDGGHDMVTTIDGGHDMVTTVDGGHDMVTTIDDGHDMVTTIDNGHDMVTTIDDGHDMVTTIDDGQDMVTTIDESHDMVTNIGDCHDMVTTTDTAHDSVTTGDDNIESTCELRQEYSMTCMQEPSIIVVSQTTPLVSETPHSITTVTSKVPVKDSQCPALTFDLPTDDSAAKPSPICDGDHSSQSKVGKMSGDTQADDQLLADLSEGHHKRERPVSVLSTCSTDTGVDLDTVSDRQRPISIISVSSVDTGYQMETDCDTVTSSWSCDEVPSIMSHSPGCAIVHQIPILDVTYTEQQCLQDTDLVWQLRDDDSEASLVSITSGGDNLTDSKGETQASCTDVVNDQTTADEDTAKMGHSTEGESPAGDPTEAVSRSPHEPDDSVDSGHTMVSKLQVSDESNDLHLSSRSTEHDLYAVCQSTPASDALSASHSHRNSSPTSDNCSIDAITDESHHSEIHVAPSSNTDREPVTRKSKLKSLPTPQGKKTRPGTEKVGEKVGIVVSQIAMSTGKASPRFRPPSLLQRRESAALKKTGSAQTVTDAKNSKNKMNEKRATVSTVKCLANNPLKPSTEALKRRSNIARKLDLTGRKTPPKILVGVDDNTSTHKRSIPKSKWGNIVSKIESGKDQQKAKPREETKSKVGPAKPDTSPGRATGHTRRLFPLSAKTLGGDVVKSKLTLTGHIATLSKRKSSSPEPSSRSSRSSVDSDRVTPGDSGVRTVRSGVKVRPPLIAVKKKRDVTGSLKKTAPSRESNVSTQFKKPIHQKHSSSSSVIKPSAIAPMKRAHQPDLVTDSLSNSYDPPEVRHLEALCEARTKQLSNTRVELQQSAVAVEALSVLVNYLCDNLNAFSCPRVTARLERSEAHLAQVRQHTEQLIIQRDALISEIQCIKQQYADAEEQLHAKHQMALKVLDEQLHSTHQAELEQVELRHRDSEVTLRDAGKQRLKEEQQRHKEHLSSCEQKHRQHVQRLTHEHMQTITDLRNEHTIKLEEITARFQDIKCSLSEKVECLKSECDGLRRSQQVNMEHFEKQSDLKARHAVDRCKYMRDEIDSLKCVLELRNDEVQGLRLQKGKLQKQLEELPVAQEKILSLLQKVENLEAIINIRDSNEKQLAERHQMLLRRYDRESKANKRLSMNNEELTWRLSQTDILSPVNITRSYSCSESSRDALTTSAKRHSSPPQGAAHSPPSAASGVVRRKKRSTEMESLRRSGTYELLNQQLDEGLRMDTAGGGDSASQGNADKRGSMRQTNV